MSAEIPYVTQEDVPASVHGNDLFAVNYDMFSVSASRKNCFRTGNKLRN